MAASRFAAALILCLATPALADDLIPGHRVARGQAGLVIGGALAAAFGAALIPLRDHPARWHHELFGAVDAAVHDQFSRRAAQISDGLIGAAVIAPIGYLTGPTIEDADGDRLVVYGEAIAINFAAFQLAKYLVQRPRPYLYSRSAEVARHAEAEGDDAYRSFYSGHAATAFCAATAGAYLTAASSPRAGLRALAWGGGFAVAAATANLRVRAGMHFYSDVVIGGAIGIAIGYAVPALHADAAAYLPSLPDLGAAAAGLLAGSLISELWPLERHGARVHFAPLPVPGGAGLALGGTL
jgi:membrane-associated phospholipid phosphatase